MAGAVRHLVQRGDGFWARIVVPKVLRAIIGKTELRTPLGSNRRIAERDVHAAVASFHDALAAARAKLEVSALPPPRLRTRPLTTAQLAHRHFAEELAHDEAAWNQTDREAAPNMAWTRQEFAKRLKRVAAGHADNDTIAATVGWAIQKFQERGNTKVEDGTIEWRTPA